MFIQVHGGIFSGFCYTIIYLGYTYIPLFIVASFYKFVVSFALLSSLQVKVGKYVAHPHLRDLIVMQYVIRLNGQL